MKKHYQLLVLFFVCWSFGLTTLHAQVPNFAWAKQAIRQPLSNSLSEGNSIAHDNLGNSYVTGEYTGSTTFGSTTLTCIGEKDFFIAKYDAAGNVLWARKAGGTAKTITQSYGDYCIGTGIAVDGSGNSYVTGAFLGNVTFGSTTLVYAGGNRYFLDFDVFVVKYDASGNVLWAKKAGNAYGDEGSGIAVDGSGNCYVTGSFNSGIAFGSISLVSTGTNDIFLAKYDASGNVLWAKKGGGTSYDAGAGLAVDGSGNCYVTGTFDGSAAFGSTTLTGSGNSNIFVAKYDASGNVLWAKVAGGPSQIDGLGIAIDGNGNSYLTGGFKSSVTFGGTTLTSSSIFNFASFVSKYDAQGNVLWAKQAVGINNNGRGIAVVANGNSYVTGTFEGSATFGSNTLSSSGDKDIFVAKYDASGNVIWVSKAGGSDRDIASSIAVDGSGSSYLTGDFLSSATFGVHSLQDIGAIQMFIAKLSVGNGNPTGVAFAEACETEVISLYPNPFTKTLTLALPQMVEAEKARVELTTLEGKTVFQDEINLNAGNRKLELSDLPNLPSGMYLVHLTLDEKLAVLKVRKQ